MNFHVLILVLFLSIVFTLASNTSNSIEIIGKYELIESENFIEYLQAINTKESMRDELSTARSQVEITREGDVWGIKTSFSSITSNLFFKLGEEFQEVTLDGRISRSVITKDGNLFTHTLNCNGKTVTVYRRFTPHQMKITMEAENITCTRIYQKL